MSNQIVVVAYDFSESANAAVLRAIASAARAPSVLHVICAIERHGLTAVPLSGPVDYQYAEKVQAKLAEVIGAELRAIATPGTIEFFVHARIGKPADEILQLATEVGADTIVVGSRGRTGVERVVLGSVAERVVREARCPVEVARPKRYDDVTLMEVVEVEPSHHRVPPYRFSYEHQQVQVRSNDWPLY
jgi:nucleotide-binding universal stress UspA family protein